MEETKNIDEKEYLAKIEKIYAEIEAMKKQKQEEDVNTLRAEMKKLKEKMKEYVECSGCGNMVLKKYGVCHKCSLKWNGEKWVDWEEEEEDEWEIL